LIRMSSELHRKRPNGMSVLCACPGEELHDIGLRALAYSLETEGWKVHYIGANTPLESIASLVEAGQPELVCLSVTMGKVEAAGLSALADRIRSCGGKLLIGGSHLTNAGRGTLSCDHSAGSIQDAIAFTRDVFALKPGPKKGSAQQGGAEPTGRA
jgi:methanogenic corrinoid protein MtbC1